MLPFGVKVFSSHDFPIIGTLSCDVWSQLVQRIHTSPSAVA